MYYIRVGVPFNVNDAGSLEDLPDALIQIKNSGQLIMAILGTVISIAFFNFAGISVAKEISATTRMVLDSVRTLVIWIVSLCLSWQSFQYLQVVGFVALLFGMCLYNNIIVVQSIMAVRNYFSRRRQDGLTTSSSNIIDSPADETNPTA